MAIKTALLGIQLLLLATLPLRASDGNTNVTAYPWFFKTQVVTQSGVGEFPSRCACITLGTNKVAFLVPAGFRLDASDPLNITMSSDDYSRVFTLRVKTPLTTDTEPLDPDTYRDLLLTTHPRATIVAQFGLNAANQFGPAFDLRWVPRGNVDRTARVAFIPSKLGVLEFSMVSSPEKFGRAKAELSSLMLSFRASGPDGKLTMPQLSDKI
jgi:hypothetical protein